MNIPAKLFMLLLQVFFLGMLVLPTTFQSERGVFLVVISGFACIAAVIKWRLDNQILIISILTLVTGALGVFVGVLNNAPGAIRVTTVFLIWPMLFLLYIGLVSNYRIIEKFSSVIFLGAAISASMGILFVGFSLAGYGAAAGALLDFQGAAFGGYEGTTEFTLYNLTTVMYGFPFVLTYLVVNHAFLNRTKTVSLWLLLFLLLLCGLVSGRRMFFLIIILTPVIVLMMLFLANHKVDKKMFRIVINLGVALVVGGLFAVIYAGIDFDVLISSLISSFSRYEASTGLRFEQAQSLWAAFISSPVIGQGLGASVDVVRSYDQPWAYELSYLALLMNVGLLGFGVYLMAVLWLFVVGLLQCRRDTSFARVYLPYATALFAFLIMNGSNPYLAKFDYLWTIFIVAALINGCKRFNRESCNEPEIKVSRCV